MIEKTAEIVNEKGLHARAAAKLVQLASSFPCETRLGYGGEEVDAKSILGLLLVAAPCGSEVQLVCEGEREAEAINALCALIAGRFEEDA